MGFVTNDKTVYKLDYDENCDYIADVLYKRIIKLSE